MTTATMTHHPALRPVARPASRAATTRLRITQRGRRVLLTLASVPLVLAAFLFALNGGGAIASLEAGAPLQRITVQSGQSLWQIAAQLAPAADTNDVIFAILAVNGLSSPDVFAGQELAIPAQYSR